MRCFLRFLHASGRTPGELASRVLAPTLYALESIPSALSPQQIDDVVRACHVDRSATGLRDHAIVLLLANYGLRAGEIVRMRLEDVDWRGDRLHVRHSKTGAQSVLPLLPAVGAALIAYLPKGRAPVPGVQGAVRVHEGALSRLGEEHGADRHAVPRQDAGRPALDLRRYGSDLLAGLTVRRIQGVGTLKG